jgi:SpoIID/LytB domain protein
MSVNETVKIGVSVGQDQIDFQIDEHYKALNSNNISDIPPGSYRARLSKHGNAPVWGCRVQTFTDETRAKFLFDDLLRLEISAELVTLGGSVEWGKSGSFETSTFAVVLGICDNIEDAILTAGKDISEAMRRSEKQLDGFPIFEDEIPRLEPIRINSPIGGTISIKNIKSEEVLEVSSPFSIIPTTENSTFKIGSVRIGINFHWDHQENLDFRGQLNLVVDGNRLTAVNELLLDQYLASVLGSEMRSDWHVEALAAQAVAARSTVLATRSRHHYGEAYQLCHDDHCQCYQGKSRESEISIAALKKVKDTVLVHNGRIADTRYAKSCGGLSDNYSVAWDNEEQGYLKPVPCGPLPDKPHIQYSENGEENLNRFLNSPPEGSACNPKSFNYPNSCKEMEDLYRWSMKLDNTKIQDLIVLRTSRDIGKIINIVPLRYGISGRIQYLRFVGESGSITVGKELNIRRILSDTHLPSSAFAIHQDENGVFSLEGIGWGHGVGLCQLGATALAEKGWTSDQLLLHYYPGSILVKG